ncbi:MAG TPA: OmpA family protein [Geobacteraceae bacterium]|nr:OmpA family protein [Geobacteraceae bacterium]
MTRNVFPVVCLLVLLFTASCAAKKSNNVFVLLPGPDGKTGEIRITSKGGTQVLREPNQAVAVSSADAAPSSPAPLDDQKIRVDFGEALSALPPPPIHFILYFKFDSTKPTEQSQKLLKQILPTMASRKSTDVSVVGHTDRRGSREYNYKLGMKRARLAQKILVSQGIDPRFISVASHGEDNPLNPTDDNVPEWRNRRVEVILR